MDNSKKRATSASTGPSPCGVGPVMAGPTPHGRAYASPAVGPLLYVVARYAWYRALRGYESVGG